MRWSSLESLRLLDDETTCGGLRNSICFLGYPFACRSLSRNRPLDDSKNGLTSVAGTLLNLAGFRNRSRHGRSMESGPEDCGA